MRRHPEHIGKQISWVRFLYMARFPARFEPEIIAEMLAPMLPGHRNLFWDHYGGRVTGLSFQEADILSTRDKEFIHTLFPDSPLYTFLSARRGAQGDWRRRRIEPRRGPLAGTSRDEVHRPYRPVRCRSLLRRLARQPASDA